MSSKRSSFSRLLLNSRLPVNSSPHPLSLSQEKRIAVEKAIDSKQDFHITNIQLEDVYEFSTSGFDPRLSHWNPFVLSSSSSSSSHTRSSSSLDLKTIHSLHRDGGNRWVTTGLMPQFVSIDLKLCWLIVEVSSLSLHLSFSSLFSSFRSGSCVMESKSSLCRLKDPSTRLQ
jgi:hypothetical protein